MKNYKSVLSKILSGKSFPQDAFFVNRFFRDRNIIIYGAGESFHYYKEIVMRKYGFIPSLILDRRFKIGDNFEGIPAYPPSGYEPLDDEKQNAIVVVCLGNQAYFGEVVQTLRNMGFQNIISLNDIYEIHNPFSLPEELGVCGFEYYLNKKEQIESVMDLFEDDLSREIYLRCMETHLSRKPVAIPMSPRSEQYVPKDIRLNRGYSRFIYCGVSAGDMACIFNQIGKMEEVFCFEPDPNQFVKVSKYLSENNSSIAGRVTLLPCAVYSRESIEPFTYSDTSFGSRILSSGKSHVQCVSIDHIIPDYRPTFINMDIEGAELEALKGAENTIGANRPDLAICLYHAPNQMWEIPLYLHGLDLGYKFYLRNYTSFVGETVLYATT